MNFCWTLEGCIMRAKEKKDPMYSKTQTTFEEKGIYREKEPCKS